MLVIPLLRGVGDSHRGPLITEGKPIFFANNKNVNELTNYNLRPTQSQPGYRNPRPWQPHRPTPAPLGRNFASLEGPSAVPPKCRLARGLDAPSGETLHRSTAGRPLGRNSASLEGYARPERFSASLEALAGPLLPHPLPRLEH
jgi:hypothetical protein